MGVPCWILKKSNFHELNISDLRTPNTHFLFEKTNGQLAGAFRLRIDRGNRTHPPAPLFGSKERGWLRGSASGGELNKQTEVSNSHFYIGFPSPIRSRTSFRGDDDYFWNRMSRPRNKFGVTVLCVETNFGAKDEKHWQTTKRPPGPFATKQSAAGDFSAALHSGRNDMLYLTDQPKSVKI